MTRVGGGSGFYTSINSVSGLHITGHMENYNGLGDDHYTDCRVSRVGVECRFFSSWKMCLL